MIPAHVEALALADAVGALDPEEQGELAAQLARMSPAEREEVTRLYELPLALAATLPQEGPAPGVRDRVLAAIATPHYTLLASDGEWKASPLPGISIKVLAVDRPRSLVTMLLRAQPGARYPSHRHSTCEECFVVAGSVVIEGRTLGAGDFHHAEGDTDHGEIYTTTGAEVLIVGAIADYLPDYV